MRLVEFRDGFRVLGHPAHAVLVHVPLALWVLVFPLELAAWALAWTEGWRLAFLANVVALAAAVPAMAAGLADFVALARRDDAPAERTAARHLYVMLGAAAMFGTEALARGAAPPAASPILNLGLALGALALLAWGGWLGGKLVFHHGVGRSAR